MVVTFQIFYFGPLLESIFNGWGLGNVEGFDVGCTDSSGITMLENKTSNLQCGSTYHNRYIDTMTLGKGAPVDWTWFHCKATQRCIHNSHRCNLHPHPDCIYEKNGVKVAEDEEGCFTEYKRKGLIQNSANFICQSKVHNKESEAVLSTVANFGEST